MQQRAGLVDQHSELLEKMRDRDAVALKDVDTAIAFLEFLRDRRGRGDLDGPADEP